MPVSLEILISFKHIYQVCLDNNLNNCKLYLTLQKGIYPQYFLDLKENKICYYSLLSLDLCENNINGSIEDDCIGSNNFSDNTYDANLNNIGDPLLGGYDQCGECNGNGTSCLVATACDLPINTVLVSNNTEIWYNVGFNIMKTAIRFFLLINKLTNIDQN